MLRKNIENKIQLENFKLKIGSINRTTPSVIYFEGKTFVAPIQEELNYNSIVFHLYNLFKKIISEEIKNSDLFDTRFILDFDIPINGIKINKKSALNFQLSVKQNNIKNFKEIKVLGTPFIKNILNKFIECLPQNNFYLYKK